MLFHDLGEFSALIGRQFTANFLPHFPEFLANLFTDFVPHRFHPLLAVADNRFDAIALLRVQIKLSLHPAREFAQLSLTWHCRHLPDGSISCRIRRRVWL